MNNTRDEAVLKAFGKHLREVRDARDLSLRKLSEKTGVDFSQIHRIEKGESNPTLTMLLKLAEGLEVNPSELLSFLPRIEADPSK